MINNKKTLRNTKTNQKPPSHYFNPTLYNDIFKVNYIIKGE